MDLEIKPSYNLARHGSVFVLSCNPEFARRFTNMLNDCNVDQPQLESLADWFSEKEDFGRCASEAYQVSQFKSISIFAFDKELALQLSEVLEGFLAENRVSGALYSFSFQLKLSLYPATTKFCR